MVFLVLKAHRALNFSAGVNELAQRIAGQGVIVTASIYVFELSCVVIALLGVFTLEDEAFNLIRCIERIALFRMQVVGKLLQDASDVSAVRRAAFVSNFAEDEHFAGAKIVGGRPIKCAPIDSQAQIALALGGKAP